MRLILTLITLCWCVSAVGEELKAVRMGWPHVESCPPHDEAQQKLNSQLQTLPPRRAVDARVSVERGESGFVAHVQIFYPPASELAFVREFNSVECSELMSAVVLFTALAANARPEERVQKSNPVVTRKSNSLKWEGHARVNFATRLGMLPFVGFGPELTLGIGVSRVRLEVEGSRIFPTTTRTQGGGSAAIGSYGAAINVCYVHPLQRFAFLGCANAGVDWLTAKASGFSINGSGVATQFTLGSMAAAQLNLLRWLSLQLAADLRILVARPSFEVEGLGVVYRPNNIQGSVRLGVEVQWP